MNTIKQTASKNEKICVNYTYLPTFQYECYYASRYSL